MPEMPSANMQTMSNVNTNSISGPEFNISTKDVEGLVLEIKENLRLSAGSQTMKSLSCTHLTRKTSRASPYHIPSKYFDCGNSSGYMKMKKHKNQLDDQNEDPYELLQKLLRDGSLVNEAVRRVKLGLTPKQRFFYDSDEESKSPLMRFFPKDN